MGGYDWDGVERELDAYGCAVLPGLLGGEACAAVAALYEQETLFRSRVVMARHGFGRGQYQYFADPLPPLVQTLRKELYPRLVPIADRWSGLLGLPARYPADHAAFLGRCHAAGQTRTTPLLLTYETGDYNCLHQDLYGEHVFPLQAAVLLSAPGEDFTGGEFLLVEQRPRMQSRPEVVPLAQGDAIVFAVAQRPVTGPRGAYRVAMRHGVSRVRSGRRRTLGVIFHDAA
ncbi:MAG TPA: 2OG-Fe(II) oxygenase [Phenylobacterium sp.]